MLRPVALAAALAWMSAPLFAQRPAPRPAALPRLVVEPDFPASRDGRGPHVEPHLAAHPRLSRLLVGAAVAHASDEGGPAVKAYVSRDGGRRWHDVSFPEQGADGGADPQVAFTPSGTALVAALASGTDESGRSRSFLHVYRTEDGGASWGRPADLGASYDHPMLAVDRGTGAFAGRAYLSVLYGPGYNLGMFRSTDDGRTWVGPVRFHRAEGNALGVNVLPVAVLGDGRVVASYHDFPIGPARRGDAPGRLGFHTVLSTDGGVTFSAPRRGPDEVTPVLDALPSRLRGDRALVAGRGARHPDRLYLVWQDARLAGGRWRILVATSDDAGATWSDPRPVDAQAPADAQQFLPAAAVNADGAVAVTWQDTRGFGDSVAFHLYASVSVDGGATFLPAQRVSTAPSRPLSGGNLAVTPTFFRASNDGNATRMVFLSAAGRWLSGGDYTGLAAAADGSFHPFWADARDGTYALWSARLRVDTAPPPPVMAATATSADVPVDVTADITFVPDGSRYDAASRELTVPLRLRNGGTRALVGPLTIEVRKFGSGMGDDFRRNAPLILNAANGRDGDGATFVLDDALGSERRLRPGDTSGAVVLRFRLRDPLLVPNMHLLVRAAGVAP